MLDKLSNLSVSNIWQPTVACQIENCCVLVQWRYKRELPSIISIDDMGDTTYKFISPITDIDDMRWTLMSDTFIQPLGQKIPPDWW